MFGNTHPQSNRVEASVTVKRPVDDVFAFYSDFRNLPRFLGDVMEIDITGSWTSRWTIEGPLGLRIHWIVEITQLIPNRSIRYKTVSASMSTTEWQLDFMPGSAANETVIHEGMLVPLGKSGETMLTIIGKSPAAEMHANLDRLRELLETGIVRNTAHAVSGKFPVAPSTAP